MTFLNMNSNSDFLPGLPAGTHRVKFLAFKWSAKAGKFIAEFGNADGIYTEWLAAETEGQKKRLKAFISHMFLVHKLDAPTAFDTLAQCEQTVNALSAMGADLDLVLVDEEYEGKVRTRLAGYFDKCIKVPFTSASGF